MKYQGWYTYEINTVTLANGIFHSSNAGLGISGQITKASRRCGVKLFFGRRQRRGSGVERIFSVPIKMLLWSADLRQQEQPI